MGQVNVYLDIDGVLLANDQYAANYVHEFLEYVTSNYSAYWLTTHCKGDAEHTVRHLSRILPHETIILLQDINPTNWVTAKTEAIDFSRPFLWFDDDLFDFEREVLMQHDALKNWIEVDLGKNENQLKLFLDHFPIPLGNTGK